MNVVASIPDGVWDSPLLHPNVNVLHESLYQEQSGRSMNVQLLTSCLQYVTYTAVIKHDGKFTFNFLEVLS
jgi:hypothetical protein